MTKDAKNWLIGAAAVLMLAAGGRSLATGEDIPDGIENILVGVISAVLLQGVTGGSKKKEEENEE